MTAVIDRPMSVWQDKVRTIVREAGEGPPLVFLHGASGLMWDPLVEALTTTHHVYAPMHPGTDGEHHDDVRQLSDVWDLVVYYAELFDALGLDRFTLVGHSFGGMVAAEIAATYPQLVEKLVLVSPLGLWRDDAPVGNPMMLDPMQLVQATFADATSPRSSRPRTTGVPASCSPGRCSAQPPQTRPAFWFRPTARGWPWRSARCRS